MKLTIPSRLITTFCAFTLLTVSLLAQSPTTTPTPVLVELFTSEGCSSCPAADDLLRQLDGQLTNHGQVIVALSEHVTYWNRLGWSDPFSSEIFTQRQNNYGDRFHLDTVYTPQVIVNGDREVVGSDREAILTAVNVQSGMSKSKLKIDSVTPDNGGFIVTYEASGPVPTDKVQLYGAIADDMDTSEVSRGENSGRVLKHVAVVRSLVSFGALQTSATATLRFPAAARGARRPGAPMRLVLFAQEANQGMVLATAISPLPTPPATDNPAVAAVH